MPFTSTERDCAKCCKEHNFKCPVHDCSKRFKSARDLVKHLQKNTRHRGSMAQSGDLYRCGICQIDFKSNKALYIQHLQHKPIHKYDLHQAACCGRYKDVLELITSEDANKTGLSHEVRSKKTALQVKLAK